MNYLDKLIVPKTYIIDCYCAKGKHVVKTVKDNTRVICDATGISKQGLSIKLSLHK